MKHEIHATFVVADNAKPWTPEVATRAVFGMSLSDLIRDIHENRDGKYDGLYVDRPAKEAVT